MTEKWKIENINKNMKRWIKIRWMELWIKIRKINEKMNKNKKDECKDELKY